MCPDHPLAGQFVPGQRSALKIWWAKQNIALRLLEMGYNVHGSDVDVFYFRYKGEVDLSGLFQVRGMGNQGSGVHHECMTGCP